MDYSCIFRRLDPEVTQATVSPAIIMDNKKVCTEIIFEKSIDLVFLVENLLHLAD